MLHSYIESVAEKSLTNGNLENSSATGPHLNNGYQHDLEADDSWSRRLPPLELEVPITHKHHKSKSPRLSRQEEIIGEGAKVDSPRHHKKRRNKHRPTSAESESGKKSPKVIVTDELGTATTINNLSSQQSSSVTPPVTTDDTKTHSELVAVKDATQDEPVRSKDETSEKLVSPKDQTHDESIRSKEQTGDKSVRPKDPYRNLKVVVDVEPVLVDDSSTNLSASHNAYKHSLNIDKKKIPRSRSTGALRTLESGDVTDEVEIITDNISPSSKAPSHSILKHSPDSSSHIMDMFQAGSRPNSVNSSKPSVRIDDTVTYADDLVMLGVKPKTKSKRPWSAGITREITAPDWVVRREMRNVKLKQTTQRKVSPHMKTSIFTMIACGIFIGAGALYFSMRAKKALKEGKSTKLLFY